MNVESILNNPEEYIDSEITVDGILHYERPRLRTCYLAKQGWNIPKIPIDQRLELQWQTPVTEEIDRSEIYEELFQLLDGNIGVSSSIIRSYVQGLPHYPFGELINVVSEDAESIADPFINKEIASRALSLLSKLAASFLPPDSIVGLANSEILDVKSHNTYHRQWKNGTFTGVLKNSDGKLTLTNVWKAIVHANDCDIYVVPRDKVDFLDTFHNLHYSSFTSVLQNPEKFYGQEICLRALFSNDFVDYENGIRYTRLIPNRLYYEFRSKWNKQISVYLKPSPLVEILTSFRTDMSGGYSTNPNHDTCEVCITGTLYPPENEHSSIILDDITELISLHRRRIYHWHPETLKRGRKSMFDY